MLYYVIWHKDWLIIYPTTSLARSLSLSLSLSFSLSLFSTTRSSSVHTKPHDKYVSPVVYVCGCVPYRWMHMRKKKKKYWMIYEACCVCLCVCECVAASEQLRVGAVLKWKSLMCNGTHAPPWLARFPPPPAPPRHLFFFFFSPPFPIFLLKQCFHFTPLLSVLHSLC